MGGNTRDGSTPFSRTKPSTLEPSASKNGLGVLAFLAPEHGSDLRFFAGAVLLSQPSPRRARSSLSLAAGRLRRLETGEWLRQLATDNFLCLDLQAFGEERLVEQAALLRLGRQVGQLDVVREDERGLQRIETR